MSGRENRPYVFDQDNQISYWKDRLNFIEILIHVVNIIALTTPVVMCLIFWCIPTSFKSLFSVLGLTSVGSLSVAASFFVFVWFTSICATLMLRNTVLCHYRTAWMLDESYKYKVFMEVSFRTYCKEFMTIDSRMSSNIRILSDYSRQTIGGKDTDVVRELSNVFRVNEKLAAMIVEKLADDPSKRMFD